MHAPLPQGSHQSRTESYQMALPGLIKERNEDTEYTGIMKIRRTMYLCSSVRVKSLRSNHPKQCCSALVADLKDGSRVVA